MGVWGVTTENNTELIAARVPTGPKIENRAIGAKIGRPTHILVCQRLMEMAFGRSIFGFQNLII